MSDHQFEKNVRKQLEELKFQPDASVWTAVEKKIMDRRKKRRGIVWIPVLFLLMAGGIFILDSNHNNNISATTLSTKDSPVDQPVPEGVDPESKPSENSSPEKRTGIAGSTENKQPSGIATDAAPDSEKKSTVSPVNKSTTGVPQPLNIPANGTALKKNSGKSLSGISTGNKISRTTTPAYTRERTGSGISESKQSHTPDVNAVNRRTPRAISPSAVFATVITDPDQRVESVATWLPASLPATVDSNIRMLTKQINTSLNDSTITFATVPPVERRKSKIQWGVSIDAGFSNVTEGGFFDVTQKSMVQDVASNSYSSPLPANAVLPMPSDIRPAPAFGAGVFIRKAVSKRIALTAGLGYSLLQTYIQVGQYTQANLMVLNARGMMGVGSVYRAGNQQHYNNQFHFLEVPLEASFRLNKRRQYPIALNAGMIAGRLIKSNALHFDGATRIYYEDNSLFNKMQFGFSGGISLGVLQGTAHPVTAGPFFHYRATSLMKYAINGERHLLSYGLNIKMLLKK